MSKSTENAKPAKKAKTIKKETTPVRAEANDDESKAAQTAPQPVLEESKAGVNVQAVAQAPILGTTAEVAPTDAAVQAEPPISTAPEPLKVPRSAFLAFRKSGGLKFSTNEFVLYPDGRIAYDVRGIAQKDYNRLRRVMNDAQVLGLRKLLDSTGFWIAQTEGKPNPDAFTYEIAARIGQRSNMLELFDGSIPDKLQPLLERLIKFLPAE